MQIRVRGGDDLHAVQRALDGLPERLPGHGWVGGLRQVGPGRTVATRILDGRRADAVFRGGNATETCGGAVVGRGGRHGTWCGRCGWHEGIQEIAPARDNRLGRIGGGHAVFAPRRRGKIGRIRRCRETRGGGTKDARGRSARPQPLTPRGAPRRHGPCRRRTGRRQGEGPRRSISTTGDPDDIPEPPAGRWPPRPPHGRRYDTTVKRRRQGLSTKQSQSQNGDLSHHIMWIRGADHCSRDIPRVPTDERITVNTDHRTDERDAYRACHPGSEGTKPSTMAIRYIHMSHITAVRKIISPL
jgi:hypothetical protein